MTVYSVAASLRAHRIVATVEARMSASRLPGKMMLDLAGRPVLIRVLERLAHASTLDEIVVATTTNPADDKLCELVIAEGFSVWRGSEDDVLQRVVDAHIDADSKIAVEICGDCPLIDATLVDLAVDTFLSNDCDVVACGVKQSYPQGTEVQVFRTEDLAAIAKDVWDPAIREHVALYFHENPDKYRIFHLCAPRELQAPDVRLQLDYAEDLMLLRAIYEALHRRLGPQFGISDVLSLLRERPELAEINAHCSERPVR